MRRALELAGRAMGRTHPNPPVGCVLVQRGTLVGEGFHAKAGHEHAETLALRQAGAQARGATAFVTLEPCSHYGQTPPCAQALIAAGVERVFVAALDPDPRVSGSGVRALRDAGIQVFEGLLEQEALRQQAGFRSLVMRGRPWVIWKYAMSLDGRTTAPDAFGRWISGDPARELVHRWRNEVEAVAVGSGTVLADDPELTTRGIPGGRSPRPVLFDTRGRVPRSARALHGDTILVINSASTTGAAESVGATVIRANDLREALTRLSEYSVSTLLLEGGATLASSFLAEGLVDEVRAFVSPVFFGSGTPVLNPSEGLPKVPELEDVTVEMIGPDLLVHGFLNQIPQLRPSEARTAAAVAGE